MAVYFMQAADGGPVKIGTSCDVEKRQRELEFHYGRKLLVLATQEGGRAEEVEIHARFSHLQIGRKEQFRPGPDLMEYIGKVSLAVAEPETVAAMPSVKSVSSVVLKGSPEYAAWLEGVHEKTHIPKMEIIRLALVDWAKKMKCPRPPKI